MIPPFTLYSLSYSERRSINVFFVELPLPGRTAQLIQAGTKAVRQAHAGFAEQRSGFVPIDLAMLC
jgi:hypothetical protein